MIKRHLYTKISKKNNRYWTNSIEIEGKIYKILLFENSYDEDGESPFVLWIDDEYKPRDYNFNDKWKTKYDGNDDFWYYMSTKYNINAGNAKEFEGVFQARYGESIADAFWKGAFLEFQTWWEDYSDGDYFKHNRGNKEYSDEDIFINQWKMCASINYTNAYEILGVNPSMSNDEIKIAFRTLALKYHPDRVNVRHPQMDFARRADYEKVFRNIVLAYNMLVKK